MSSVRFIQVSKSIVYPKYTFVRTFGTDAADLKAILRAKIPEEKEKILRLRKEFGRTRMADITVNAMYDGLNDTSAFVWEPSNSDADGGVEFRGYTMQECVKLLPRAKDGDQPLPEGVFWLLLTGDVPSEAQTEAVSREWVSRAQIPAYVANFLDDLSPEIDPLVQMSSTLTIMSEESNFAKAYSQGIVKASYWEYIYEDCIDLIAKLPVIAAMIYRKDTGVINVNKDWTNNFVNMLGYDNGELTEFLRLFFTVHSDDAGGSVSSHAIHLVGSALSNPYLSFAAGINGLAGPLHNEANRAVIWLENVVKSLGVDPTEEQLERHILNNLKSRQTIPGYGHFDPRFACLCHFAQKHLPENEMFKLAMKVNNVLKRVQIDKSSPTAESISGVLLQHYGMTDVKSYYTILIAISRVLGTMAQMIWSRALGFPIENPKSFSTDYLINKLKKND